MLPQGARAGLRGKTTEGALPPLLSRQPQGKRVGTAYFTSGAALATLRKLSKCHRLRPPVVSAGVLALHCLLQPDSAGVQLRKLTSNTNVPISPSDSWEHSQGCRH